MTMARKTAVQLADRLPYFFGIEIFQVAIKTEKVTHRPRGTMCTTCADRSRDCSGLPFERMRAIGKDAEGLTIVICTEHKATPRVKK